MSKTLTVPEIMLRDIIANPTDLTVRSIYADWLEEYEDVDTPSVWWIINSIRNKNVTRCTPKKEDKSFGNVQEIEFRHGFIEVIKAPFEILCANLTKWVTEYPLTSVEVSDKEPHVVRPSMLYGWGHYIPHQTQRHYLTLKVWRRLSVMHSYLSNSELCTFTSLEQSTKALSDTLLDMARNRILHQGW